MSERPVTELAAWAEIPARIRVLEGSLPDERTFQRGVPSRLTIGSAETAALRIERSDVAPRQLDVVWDGTQLWVQDALRLGRTFVNGRTLNEWTPIVGHALVRFGGVRLGMVTRSTPPPRHAPDFAALDRACLTDDHQSERLRLRETGRLTLPPELTRLVIGPGAR